VATPYLPSLIEWASSRWTRESVSRFVLGLEVSIGALLIISAAALFIYNRRRFLRFSFIMGCILTAAFLFYRTKLNPYELTHFPEYAILSILVIQAMKRRKSTPTEKVTGGAEGMVTARATGESLHSYLYCKALAITVALGAIDELYQGLLPTRYFNVYDILLNGLGGVLGLTFVWGISRE